MTWPNCRGRALPLQRFALISGGNLTKSRIMKVAIPGRAIKMQELNESGGSGQAMNPLLRHGKVPFNDIRIRPAIDYLSPSAQASSSVGDAPHIGHRDWNRTAKLYRKELKAKGNARPSTAVRQHVKKISEEFAMTQTKFENSVNTVGAAKTLDARGKFPPSLASPAPLASRYPQSTKVARGVFSKITCSKCESITKASRKGALAPSAASPAGAACKDSKGHVSKSQGGKGKGSGAAAAAAAAASPQKKVSASLSPPGSRPRQRHQSGRGGGGVPDLGLAPSSPAAQPRSPVRKTSSSSSSSSALGGVSPRSKQMSSEQIKKVKVFTEKAIMEGRVFSTFGYFPAIKDALRRRGWVEKIQHTVPYVNPHPNNCVCPHVGYQVTSLPLPNSQQPPGRAGSSPTATAASRSAQERAGDESSPPAGDDGAAAGEGQALRSGASPSAPSPPPPPSSGKSSPAEGQDAAITASTGSSSVESLAPRQDRGSVDSAPGDAENRSSSDCQSRATGRSSSIAEEPCDSSPTGLPGNSGRLNTAILGPSEIRRGIAEAINEKNATIFRYSTIHVPKRRTHNDSKAVDSEKAVEAKENPEETSVEGEEEGEEEAPAPADEEEAKANPEPYNPYVDYELCDMDLPLVARLLRNVEPNFLWTWTRDSISFKHLSREQVVNRFPNTPFTTKYGLCETLQQLHWFSEAASVETFVPRGYCIGHEDERTAFIHDYRLTACLNVLKWITERRDTHGPQAVADPHGEVPTKRVRQALVHVEQFIQSCCHDDLDSPPPTSLRDHEWDALLAAHYKIVHMDKKIKVATPAQLQALVSDCESALQRAVPHWPQLAMDGLRNLWIVKPGAQSRGRGIFMMNHLEEILALVQSPLIYETKYVVQKYMERPMLIHNTKFDIRQWFLVTDWNPLHVWVYKECYLRFCSQQYDLSNNNEAVHLSNNAIQCKYLNGERSGELPEENMWDCDQFKDYLRGLKKERTWEEVIYPGMRDALVAAMLAAQVEMDTFKHGFELFGADFMLTEDLKPWLIEINSSPCMAPTTSVTRRMCANCLQDVIKVLNVLFLLILTPYAQSRRMTKSLGGAMGGDVNDDKCRLFSEPSEELKEFYSPMYPNHYPNNTECILRLEAKYGYMIQIDFRDYFELEPSEKCDYDFLEVRDGAHGYSDLKGRYCGQKFPPIITSKDRYLWLRFNSDENIEYMGFRAVYKFMKNTALERPEVVPCQFEMSGVQGLVSNTNITQATLNYSINYDYPVDCTWVIRVKSTQKIYMFFETFDLAEPNECDINYVDIFGKYTDLRHRLKHYCGSVADPFVTNSNLMHFRFFTAHEQASKTKFSAWYTAFRDRMQDGEDDSQFCTEDEYDCDDATCIDKSLRCNKVKNCRHEYDEEGCEAQNKAKFNIQKEHIIIILTLGCGLLGGMCFAMCFNCIRKLIRDGRQIHENIRRSREQLEERSQRSQSMSITSSPQTAHRPTMNEGGRWYISDAKTNGHPCIRPESESESEVDEDEDEEEIDDMEESCVEMRDCECQTRDSLLTQRDSGQTQLPMTPPPPPPPNRRPPGLPPLSPGLLPSVPTPPPPPGTHYVRAPTGSSGPPSDHYGSYGRPPVPRCNDPYEVDDHSDDPYGQRYRAEAVIEMRERGPYEPAKSPKTTPDVLATH